MTHRSRLTSVLIDAPAADHARAVDFWAGALGRDGRRGQNLPEYVSFGQPTPGIEVMVQATGDATPRVHIDIEADDVEAEVTRLTALGATEVRRVHTWVIMRDPVGTVFCVVHVQNREAFEAHATTWE